MFSSGCHKPVKVDPVGLMLKKYAVDVQFHDCNVAHALMLLHRAATEIVWGADMPPVHAAVISTYTIRFS
jgi:hypothetical protein